MQDHPYFSRLPILDRQQHIVGYALLFHDGALPPPAVADTRTPANLPALVRALRCMGPDWPMGDKLLFLDVDAPSLGSEALTQLPAEGLVLQIASDALDTEKSLTQCRHLRARGLRFALVDFEPSREVLPLLEIAGFIKVNSRRATPEQTEALARSLEEHPAGPLIERVESPHDFDLFRKTGAAYFQGFFFAHPETLGAKVINPAHATVLDLLEKVRNNADIAEIELPFKRDVALSFKLLRYINSVGFGLSCEIQSIRHALAILGYQQLYRWLTLLLVTAGEGTPPALMRNTISRGRLTELLGQAHLGPDDRDNLFIVGVFSQLDVMLEMPMEKVLDRLFLPESINDALLYRQGIYGPFLALAEACEDSPGRVEKLALALQLESDTVNLAHLEALAWTEKLGL
jgi:EAL and modified HD-GYP domain-containing signal transduction protein